MSSVEKEISVVQSTELPYTVSINWQAIEGADRYRVQVSKDGGVTWQLAANHLESTECVVRDIYAGQSYQILVIGYVGGVPTGVETHLAAYAP